MLALPKQGLFADGVPQYTSELYLADISVPSGLYGSEALSLQIGVIFSEGDVVRVV